MPQNLLNPSDPSERASLILGNGRHFQATNIPSQSGIGTRQGRLPNERIGVSKRKMMRWLVPEQPIIEMYVNPENVNYSYGKHITEQRTKGGYVLQYWGENLINLTLTGTTGTSGIEGINVLYDVYRNEQVMFDPYALALQAQQSRAEQLELLPSFSDFGIGGTIGEVGDLLFGGNQAIPATTRARPSLASLAFTVELYWSGEVYRGYFKDFQVVESAQKLGFFNYTINFRATQRRGFRQNFLAWHRSAVNGPSNSNPIYGTPHSFGQLSGGVRTPPLNNIDQPNLNSPFVEPNQSGLNSIGGAGAVQNRSTSNLLNAFDV